MERYLEKYIVKDLPKKIVLVSGPRQVGKTTLSKQIFDDYEYLSFDSEHDRRILIDLAWDKEKKLLIFDELHKMKKWKQWLKGVYDTQECDQGILVTGSARMDVYRKNGDSMAGRFFSFRLNPITVREVKNNKDIMDPLGRIMRVGGFPEPFFENDDLFVKRWRKTHLDTILRQDLLDLERVRDIKSIEILIDLLRMRVGSPVSYASLAGDLQVSIPTVKHWIQILENMYVIFSVTPYHRNIARSLLKEPKYYFYDVSAVEAGEGARFENLVAMELKSYLDFVEDTTGSRVALHYLRDKEKREVDFITFIDKEPERIIEVKLSDNNFAESLFHFSSFFKGKDVQVFQVVKDLKRKKQKGNIRLIDVESLAEIL